jgi:hypothetical protein
MKKRLTLTIDGKSQDLILRSREPYAPKEQVVKSKKVYSRKVKHKSARIM